MVKRDMGSTKRRCCIVVLMVTLLSEATGQSGIRDDPLNQNAGRIFFLDSNSDCNGPVRELNGYEATVMGFDLSAQREGPTSCTLSLRSQSTYLGTILYVQVVAASILDCGTNFAIYDGEASGNLMNTYDCRTNAHLNRKYFQTSGNTVTFLLTRQNTERLNFNIEIDVKPLRGGREPGYENNYGKDFEFFDKFEQEAIVGIIGGAYLLTILICVAVIIYFYRKYQGMNKEWETHQLAAMKTDTSLDVRNQSSKVWSMEMKQGHGASSQYSRGPSSTYPVKRGSLTEDGESGVYYPDDTFQKRRLMNEERERERQRRLASNNTSFIHGDEEEEDDPDNFVEKVITPRVRSNNRNRRRPPSYEEATSERASDQSSEEEEEETEEEEDSSDDESTRKRPLSSDEETETESEEESDEDDSRRGRGARARGRRRRNQKPRHRNSSLTESDAASSRPGNRRPQQQPYGPPPPQAMPYGVYPQQGQFVPMMAAPPAQFQPVQMVPNMPPPHYPDSQPRPSEPQIQPTDPPVYSYLVRRGYTPLDRSSPASTAGSGRSGGARLEDNDVRLESGVEYMRR